jgi:hypothetical protein
MVDEDVELRGRPEIRTVSRARCSRRGSVLPPQSFRTLACIRQHPELRLPALKMPGKRGLHRHDGDDPPLVSQICSTGWSPGRSASGSTAMRNVTGPPSPGQGQAGHEDQECASHRPDAQGERGSHCVTAARIAWRSRTGGCPGHGARWPCLRMGHARQRALKH